MYRTSTPPPPREIDDAIDRAVDVICERVTSWTRWIDRGGVALGAVAGLSMLWLMRHEGEWGAQRIVYLVVALGTIVVARAMRAALLRVMLGRWITQEARTYGVSPPELAHRVRMALTVVTP